jgi:anti-sigma factor RsiW
MTCAEIEPLLDAFVDGELSGPTLLAVARHTGGCPTCESAVRRLVDLQAAVDRVVRSAAERLDLSSVWPVVQQAIAPTETRRAWSRRLRTVPVWGAAAAALAAGAVFWLRAPLPERVAGPVAHARPNQAVIERLVSSDGARVVRDRKYGTTLIMVNAQADEALP